MKLCIVASGDFFSNYGGGQVYVRNLVDEIVRQKDSINIELSVLSIAATFSNAPEKKRYKGIDIFEINNNGNVEQVLSEINPDIVHANGEKLFVSRICKKKGIPCVVTAHHGGIVCPAGALLNTEDKICTIPADYDHCLKCYLRNTRTGLLWYPLLRRCSQEKSIRFGKRLRKFPFIPYITPIGETGLIVSEKINNWHELSETATHFIAPSNAIAEALKRNGCLQDKISVVPHGIPVNTNICSTLSIQKPTLTKFYYVGRINYVKGIHILLKAFSQIKNNCIELHIIGDAGNNSERRYKKHLQKKFYRDHRIIWHGKLGYDQMTNAIQNFHCLIHPAIYLEVFGLNITEALSQHKYVIATRCGGAEMQIHNENEGVLVTPNDVDALKKAISQYISEPKQSEAEIIDIESHIRDLYKIYSSI